MSAVEVLKAARAAGIQVTLDGDALMLEAAVAPSPAVLDQLAHHKADLIALLRLGNDGWSGEDWLAFFDERTGIAECDFRLPRADAEARAFARCVAEWLNRNFVPSPPGRCLVCGGGEVDHESLVPVGIASTGHVWLHSRCREAWYTTRKAAAVTALLAMGIPDMRTSR
jgi:hypothetical protein